MITAFLAWISKPANMVITVLAVLLIVAVVYVGIVQVRLAIKDKEIAEKSLKAEQVKTQILEAQNKILSKNLEEIAISKAEFQKIKQANDSIRKDIANLPKGKDGDSDEAIVYKRIFDQFTNGVLPIPVPAGSAASSKDKLPN
jgi:Tfp pilus assembly protein PilO